MTWTGKTNKKDTKKISLKSFTKITKLLISLSRAADIKYTDALFAKTIVYKILKYAYRINSSNDDDSDARATIEEPIVIALPTNPITNSNENAVIHVSTSDWTQPNQLTFTAPPHSHQMQQYSYMQPMSNWANGHIWPPQQNVMQPPMNMQSAIPTTNVNSTNNAIAKFAKSKVTKL